MDKVTINGHCEIIRAERAGDEGELEKLEISVNSLNQVSDGCHTIAELYDHRITLYIALCRSLSERYEKQPVNIAWRSKKHYDGTGYDGLFMLGLAKKAGKQITYHIPLDRWDETNFADTYESAPVPFDGHTSADVLERLKTL